MNLSLKNRVALSFVLANLIIIGLGLTMFHFLGRMNKSIESISKANDPSFEVNIYIDDLRAHTIELLKYQHRLVFEPSNDQLVDKIIETCDQLEELLGSVNTNKVEGARDSILKMMGHVESIKLFLQKGNHHAQLQNNLSITELTDKIIDAFSEIQNIRNDFGRQREYEVSVIINQTKQNMMYTLIITFVATMLLGLIIPGKIALPFKKVNDAIRELQECNFDVNIYYNQDDEMGEIAHEMNRMIVNLKKFEELRAERIQLEVRKFDTLANAIQKQVLVANAKGELIYINGQLFSLLEVQSEDVINKSLKRAKIPTPITESFALAIKRRSKIENAEIVFPRSSGEEFRAYATIFPIRGKDSANDYYLMVLSQNVFV